MAILRDLFATLAKMFAADLGLTITALASVALAGGLLATHIVPASAAPLIIAAGAFASLAFGVFRPR